MAEGALAEGALAEGACGRGSTWQRLLPRGRQEAQRRQERTQKAIPDFLLLPAGPLNEKSIKGLILDQNSSRDTAISQETMSGTPVLSA